MRDALTETVVGLDIGKTKIAAGIVTVAGEVVLRHRTTTDLARGGAEILDQCRGLIRRVLQHGTSSPTAIGIGSSGIVDHERGVIVSSGSIPGWSNIEIRSLFEQEFALPVRVDNDVCAAALGEHRFGAARGASTSVLLIIGTGIGFCAIVSGAIWHGAHNLSGQIAHLPLFDSGHTVNDLFSGLGLASAASEQLGAALSTRDVFRRAELSDETAAALVERAVSGAAVTIAWIQNTIDPDIVVIGGGVGAHQESFVRAVEEQARQLLVRYEHRLPAGLKLVTSRLADDIGVIGAAALCMPQRVGTGSI